MNEIYEYVLYKIIPNVLIVAIPVSVILGFIYFGLILRKKFNVTTKYFWTAYTFISPILASPLVYFASLFLDRVKNDALIPLVLILLYSYPFWFIVGFIRSMKSYGKVSTYIAILPVALAWIIAFGAIWLGSFLLTFDFESFFNSFRLTRLIHLLL